MIRSVCRNIFSFSKHQQHQLDPTAYYHNRKEALSSSPHNYPYNFTITRSIESFQSLYHESIQESNQSLAGRVSRIRNHGRLSFLDIKQNGFKVQVAVQNIDSKLKRGDIVGVRGIPFRTHKGQLTIKANDITLLAPCFHMLPQEENLKDVEIKHRKRYLDLITNRDSLGKLKVRSKVIQFLRTYLIDKGFLEVETPCLSTSAGGAIAKPFVSYLHEMDMELYMRIAPELYLKQLLVGGVSKVFELGKNFRNEGIDPTHNPQFTTLQLYQTYRSYEDMMTMTEDIMKQLVKLVTGSFELNINGQTVSFREPWKRISLVQGIEEATKSKLPKEFQSEEAIHFLNKLCLDHKIECAHPRTPARLLDKLSSHFLQGQASPLFISEYPTCMSPLAKTCPDNHQLTQRFEGFINGWEICNSYTELNDPELQLKNTPKDQDFVECLEYGLPPCAGLGIGIDRLLMLLTNSPTIQEVIAFPLMKPRPKD